MIRQIKWGVLGYAGIARKHVLPAMLHAENAMPYAIASRSEEKLQEAVKLFGFKKTYTDYEALLADPQVEAVYIPLPNALHKEWTIKAAQHGKHILCEKPLALTQDDCQEMIDVCRKHHVKLMEAFMYRFTTRTKTLMELLAQGIIGEVKHINSTHRFLLTDSENVRTNAELGGGSLRDVGCYPINMIGLIVDDYPQDICALKKEINGVDYATSAVLRYPNGVFATVSSGFDAQSTLLTEINGTKGCILMRDSFIDTDTPILVISSDEATVTEYPVQKCERYQLEIEEFSQAVLENREPALSLEETMRNIKLMQEITDRARC